jgi:hypothetical protein
MRNLLFLIAILLILGYTVGVLPLSARNLVHLLLTIGLIAVLLAAVSRQGLNR